MIEAKTPFESSDPKADILAGVVMQPELAATLSFDTLLGSLVQPGEDEQFRMLVFRAHNQQDSASSGLVNSTDIVNLDESSRAVTNSVYGTGLYTGNSAAAVGLFQYARPNREIGVYLTPPITHADMLDARTDDSTSQRLKKILSKQALIRTGHSDSVLANMDAAYGDSKLVILDKALGTVVAQNAQVKNNIYPVRPYWYLLRGISEPLERVGTAAPIEPRRYFELITTMRQKRKNR